MKLLKLAIGNFKRIESIEIPPSDVNILVGANGSGKSSVIQAIHLACGVMRQADRVNESKTSTVWTDELDSLPTDDCKTLGHGANWGNRDGAPSSLAKLTGHGRRQAFAACRLRCFFHEALGWHLTAF